MFHINYSIFIIKKSSLYNLLFIIEYLLLFKKVYGHTVVIHGHTVVIHGHTVVIHGDMVVICVHTIE